MALIAVDMTPVRPGGENGGAKILVLELLKSFQEMAPNDHFLLLTASWNDDELATLDAPNMGRLCVLTEEGPNINIHQPHGRISRRLLKLYRGVRRRFKKYAFIGHGPLASRAVDLLFCPFTAPTYAEQGIKTVSIVYDLQHLDFPQFFSQDELDGRNGFFEEVRCRSDYIICISEKVRQTVIKYLKTDPNRTSTVHICIQSKLCTPDVINTSDCLGKLGINQRPYMFYPANFWPHKNHRMLLTAFNIFLSRHPEYELDLVFTGALDKLQEDLKNAVKSIGLSERVHFLGFVSREQLAAVWEGCEFLIFPSLYEGFGIPLLEAMAFGKPVVCSNTTSLPEVGGEAALYFDPRNPAEIVKCIEQIVYNVPLREEMKKRGSQRASEFKTENMVRNYLDILYSAINKGNGRVFRKEANS